MPTHSCILVQESVAKESLVDIFRIIDICIFRFVIYFCFSHYLFKVYVQSYSVISVMIVSYLCSSFLKAQPQCILGLCCCCLVAKSCPALCDLMDCSLQGSSLHWNSRWEYWSGLPFPPPGDLPDPGIESTSPTLAGGFFTAEPPRKDLWH